MDLVITIKNQSLGSDFFISEIRYLVGVISLFSSLELASFFTVSSELGSISTVPTFGSF